MANLGVRRTKLLLPGTKSLAVLWDWQGDETERRIMTPKRDAHSSLCRRLRTGSHGTDLEKSTVPSQTR